ncbi:endonuclease VII domain-containing protein [Streptomyces sp. NPDC053079]|uniref:endonuclease VII domain-containing protein n=1 Tax=Streptomyces sp. NPDC053079 TaxID=3365697 RepID=UPI0037D56D78
MDGMRQCTKCLLVKSVEDFSPRGKRDGVTLRKSRCKPCVSEAARNWAAENRERATLRRQRWNLQNTYGITLDKYNAMLSSQGGVCAICEQDEPNTHGRTGRKFSLSVDHCHDTGRVRGLLCQKCNRAVGLLNDNVDLLRKAIDYLERE